MGNPEETNKKNWTHHIFYCVFRQRYVSIYYLSNTSKVLFLASGIMLGYDVKHTLEIIIYVADSHRSESLKGFSPPN